MPRRQATVKSLWRELVPKSNILTNWLINAGQARKSESRDAPTRRERISFALQSVNSARMGLPERVPTRSPNRRGSTRRCSTTTSRARMACMRRRLKRSRATSSSARWRRLIQSYSAGERLVRAALDHFDRILTQHEFQSLHATGDGAVQARREWGRVATRQEGLQAIDGEVAGDSARKALEPASCARWTGCR